MTSSDTLRDPASVDSAKPPFDPYALSPAEVEEPPTGFVRSLRHVGPGLILAGAIVGTGELIATTNLGAKVGFVLLWLVVVSCFIKVFVQAELGRYAISSGETTMAAFNRLPGPGFLVGGWWVIMMLTTQFQIGAMIGGIGQAVHMVVPAIAPAIAQAVGGIHAGLGDYLAARPEVFWGTIATLATSAILAIGSYRIVESGTMLLVVLFTFATVACVALLPAAGHPLPWNEIAAGFEFKLPVGEGAIAAALTMFGITGVGAAELVAYPYWCIEKGYARKAGVADGSADWLRRARGWIAVMRVDIWFSLAVYTLATLAFYLLGAALLHAGDGVGLKGNVGGMLVQLSQMYRPVMGEAGARWFIVIGVFAVLYSTLFAATSANSRALADYLRVNRIVQFRTGSDRTKWVRLFCVSFPIVDLVLYLSFGDAVKMVMYGGLAQAATLPLLGTAAIWLRYKHTDQRLAPGKVWDAFLWLSVLGLWVAGGYLFVAGVSKLIGQ